MSTYAGVQGAIYNAQPIPYAGGVNLLKSEKAPYAIPCACDFGATGIPAAGYILDPSRFYNSGAIKTIQSLFIDNSQVNGTTQVYIPAFNQLLSIPPYSQGYFAILAPLLSGGVMYVTSSSVTGGIANVLMLNTLFTTQIWSTLSTSQGSSIPVADAILDGTVSAGNTNTATQQSVRTRFAQLTATDRSGVIVAAGVSQLLAAANPARQGLELQNIDGVIIEALWYNPNGGAAVIGGAGSFSLAAAASANNPGGAVKIFTSNAVNIIAATINHKFTAIEY